MGRFFLVFLPAAVVCALVVLALRQFLRPRPAPPVEPGPRLLGDSETMALLDDLENLLPSGAHERRAGLARVAARVAEAKPEPTRSRFFMAYMERSSHFSDDLVGSLTITKNILDSLSTPQSPRESAEQYSELFQIYDYLDQMTWKRLLLLLEVLGFVSRDGEKDEQLLSRTPLGGELLARVNDYLDLGSIEAEDDENNRS